VHQRVNGIRVSIYMFTNSAVEPCSESMDSCLTCFHNIFLTFIVTFYKSYASMAWHAVWVVNGQDDLQKWKNICNKQSV
jgi:hypothetical protein